MPPSRVWSICAPRSAICARHKRKILVRRCTTPLASTTRTAQRCPGNVDPDRHEASLNEQDAETLYLIAQEALRNVERHAHASRVVVTVQHEPAYMLTIQDDGLGFDMHSVNGHHFGLRGMAERADMIGAQVRVEKCATPGHQRHDQTCVAGDRGQGTGVRGQGTGVRSQKSGDRSQGTGVRSLVILSSCHRGK